MSAPLMVLNQTQIKQFINEDAPKGDITSLAIFSNKTRFATAQIVAKEDIVVSGFVAVKEVLKNFRKIKLKITQNDGTFVKKGTLLAEVKGPVTDLLLVERTVLNFLQRLSGIATLTQRFVRRVHSVHGVHLKILDTRKTTPGLRELEKKAVRDGGGVNHRIGLSDQYLIKDNHIDAAGSITEAIIQVRAHQQRQKKKAKIEVEVRNSDEFLEALMFRTDIILLDNMSPRKVRDMVLIRKNKCLRQDWPLLEVSGGVTLKTLKEYCKTGVERISIGALTHSARAVDISMKIKS